MLLYAETHYPRHLPNLVRRAEPEILTDLPWRIEPGHSLPILLAVRDAHWYPVHIHEIRVELRRESAYDEELIAHVVPVNADIDEPWWWRNLDIPTPGAGTWLVSPVIRYDVGNGEGRTKTREMVADNYRGTNHTPFRVSISASSWPMPDGWLAGDCHVHSDYTRDQVEFGPPVASIAAMSKAMGIGWVCITDHSYDLDDTEDDFLVNDPALPRWKALGDEIDQQTGNPVIIKGEEVSCGNYRGENVHLLGMGISEYLPGSGDSGEIPAKVKPELTVSQASRRIQAQGGIAVAAHPGAIPSWIERIIFRRGWWRDDDTANPALSALQTWNGARDAAFDRAHADWIRLLLAGRRIPALAGSDSHGSFGRYRQLRFPWFSLSDNRTHLFGATRTVVRCPNHTEQDILDAMREGRCYLTDGPEITIAAQSPFSKGEIGDTVRGTPVQVALSAKSITEFGSLVKVGIGVGVPGSAGEVWHWRNIEDDNIFDITADMGNVFDDPKVSEGDSHVAYVRAEVWTGTGRSAFTNPIWINGAE
jgi:hypothetical protein